MRLTTQLNLLVMLVMATMTTHAQIAASKQMTDVGREGLTGVVHIVRSDSEDSVGEGESAKTVSRRRNLGEMTFDDKGRLTQRVIYDDYGFLVGAEVYTYDDKGNRLTAMLTGEKGEIISKDTYVYDAGSKLTEKVSYEHYPEQQPATIKTAYVYDSGGRLTEETYSYQSKPVGKTIYKYDAKGNAVEMAFFGGRGEKAFAPVGPCFSVHRLISVGDDKGRIVEQSAYEPDGSLKRKTNYTYDDRGNITMETRKDDYGSLTYKRTYEFDARGNWIKQKIETIRKSSWDSSIDTHHTEINRAITYY